MKSYSYMYKNDIGTTFLFYFFVLDKIQECVLNALRLIFTVKDFVILSNL